MLKSLFRLSWLTIVSVGIASLSQAQVSNSPVVLVDSTLEQCSLDPSLIAYPCVRTIQEAVNGVGNYTSGVILILPTATTYEGFSVGFGKLRSLLIQGFRGTPRIQGRISLDGSGDWVVVLKNLALQGQGPLITLGLTGAPIFVRLEEIVADAQGTAVSVREAVVLEITNSWFSGNRSGCGLELGGGSIKVSNTTIEGFEKGICDRPAAPAKDRFIILSQNVEILGNRGRGVELKALGTAQFGVFITTGTMWGNSLDGLYLVDVDYGTIASNTIVGSEQSFKESSRGLYIRARASPVGVEHNTIGNFAYGIEVAGPGLVDISYNTIQNYRLCGVVNNGRQVTGVQNIITDEPGVPALCPSPASFPAGFRR